MERFTISLDGSLAGQFDRLMATRGYRNRSEAVRGLIRAAIESGRRRADGDDHRVANRSYVFNHHERELEERLTTLQPDRHALTVAALHGHLDHETCRESVGPRGPTQAVRRFADTLVAERDVRHGKLNRVALEAENRHIHDASGETHVHFRPPR